MKGPHSTEDPAAHTPNSQQDLDFLLYLSYSDFYNDMNSVNMLMREDEYDVDFENTTEFALVRWHDLLAVIEEMLLPQDGRTMREHRDFQFVSAEIAKKRVDPFATANTRRLMNQLQPLPRALYNLTNFFQKSIRPLEAPVDAVWSLFFLTIKLSHESPEKLKRVVEWNTKLRRVIELFNKTLEACKDEEINEARICMIDLLEPLLCAFADTIKYLRNCHTDAEALRHWPALDVKLIVHLTDLDATLKHLNELTNYSAANRERQQRNLRQRHDPVQEPEEPGKFPLSMVTRYAHPRFYGRTEELDRINRALDWRNPENSSLRTYTIYGRRGVGKTDLALKYAETNPAKFDAIFWIACETSLSLRASFTNMAIALNLPGADKHGHAEENQLACLSWLKTSRARWLMIYDNAENEQLLKSYWPLGANGAILITSRKYINFFKVTRKGDTVKPFDANQSFQLMCNLLGDDWVSLASQRLLKPSEVVAAKEFLGRLEGLALAIQQAVILIKNERIGGPTIETTFELYKQHARTLPDRQTGKRSQTYHALDTLWDMNFRLLSNNARQLLSVLALLSPDNTYIELFLPRRQAALNGKLAFCKQQPYMLDSEAEVTLTHVVAPTRALEEALNALRNASLIRQEGRVITVHREVQDAMNYYSAEDLQQSFIAAVALVAEAFPKRQLGSALIEQWAICSQYIHDGVHLAYVFSSHTRPPLTPRLKGTDEFIELIYNCAWYLYEVSDYDGALGIIEIGFTACESKETLLYANLCNTASSCYLEKNQIVEARVFCLNAFRIRQALLDKDNVEIASSNVNLGNVESADGNYNEAMDYFNNALRIQNEQGDSAANQLAILYLCIGRCLTLQRNFDEASKMFAQAEALFVRTLGADRGYMAHVQYAYGNLEYARGNWLHARRAYSEAQRIAVAELPIHPITAAAHYSLGCVEYKLKHHEVAKFHLEKAKNIAELRSPTREDGTITRILWMMARVLEMDPLSAAQAEQLKLRAQVARSALMAAGEAAAPRMYDEDGNLYEEDEEDIYDSLVPGFFR